MKLTTKEKKGLILFAKLAEEVLESQGRQIQALMDFVRNDYKNYQRKCKRLAKKRPLWADVF